MNNSQNINQNRKGTNDDTQSLPEHKKILHVKLFSRAIRLICPIFVPLGWLWSVRTFNKSGLDFSYGISFFVVYFGILIPFYCFAYGLNVLKNEKDKDSFVACNPVISGVACICLGFPSRNAILLQLILCGWIAIWTYIPICIHNLIIKNTNKISKNEEPINHGENALKTNIISGNFNLSKSKQAFSERCVNEKSYSLQMKQSIFKIIRLTIPFYFPFVWFIFSEAIYFIIGLIPKIPISIGESFVWFILFPISCFIYGFSVAKSEKKKYFFAFYYPVVSLVIWLQAASLFGILAKPLANKMPLLIYVVIAFFLGSLLPVWVYNYKHKSKKAEEQ